MELEEFCRKQGEWALKTFPMQTTEGKWNHFIKEVKELAHAIQHEHENIGPEIADCILLLMSIGYNLQVNVGKELITKFNINQNRKEWQLEPDGSFHHI